MNTVSELAKLERDIESLNRRLTGARQSIETANFLVLVDTPASYAGQDGKFTQVNVGETGLQFAPITAEDVQAGTFPAGEYIFQAVVTGIDPTLSQHLATKEYVDTAINVEIDFFLNNTPHDIGGIYYNMRNFESGEGEATFTIGPLGGGDGQALVNFATISGEPGTFALPSGVFSGHIHAEKTIGNRSVEIYFELYKRTDPGGVETLLVTSELSDPIDAKTGVSLHAAIGTETELNTTDILVVKWFANLGNGGPTTIALYAEGNNVSRFTIPIESSIFNAIYVRQDGTTPLTGDWDVGNFDLTMKNITIDGTFTDGTMSIVGGALSAVTTIQTSSWVHLDADSAELRLGQEVNDYTIQWDGNDAVHTIVAGDFVFLGGDVGIKTTGPTHSLEVYQVADSISDMVHFGDGTYGFFFQQSTGAGFIPFLIGRPKDSTDLFILGGEIEPADDVGTVPVFRMTARQTDSTAIETRPLFSIANVNDDMFLIDKDANVGFRTTTFQAACVGVLAIKEGTAPGGATADQGYLWVQDDGGTAEMYVQDGAGVQSKISPHNKDGEWEFLSKNIKTGKTIRINMEKMIRKLESYMDETFIEEFYESVQLN